MVDIVEKAVRSRMMAAIRGKNTQPEMLLRRFLHANGFRYRLHVRTLPGSPDIVLPKYCLVIFVHGCFWHQHCGCKYAAKPDERSQKWEEKFTGTLERDRRHILQLQEAGWRVFTLWECGLSKAKPRLSLEWLPEMIKNCDVRFFDWPKFA